MPRGQSVLHLMHSLASAFGSMSMMGLHKQGSFVRTASHALPCRSAPISLRCVILSLRARQTRVVSSISPNPSSARPSRPGQTFKAATMSPDAIDTDERAINEAPVAVEDSLRSVSDSEVASPVGHEDSEAARVGIDAKLERVEQRLKDAEAHITDLTRTIRTTSRNSSKGKKAPGDLRCWTVNE